MTSGPRILYCHCQYAQVVPAEVKEAVLKELCASGMAFDSVADLCEMSARRDPTLLQLASGGAVKIAACYPRAVKGLFVAVKAPLAPEKTEVLNMRTETAETIVRSLFDPELRPNLAAEPATVEAAAPTETQAGTPNQIQNQ